MATTDLKRGYILLAVALGCAFQLSQFVRSQQAILGKLDPFEVGDHPSQKDPPPVEAGALAKGQQIALGSVAHGTLLTDEILARIKGNVDQEVQDASTPEEGQRPRVDIWSALGGNHNIPSREGGSPEDVGSPEQDDVDENGSPLVDYNPFFEATKFNYSQPTKPTEYTLPAPNRTNQSTIVICLSARDNFERRAAIRETWSKGNDNVYFVIGGPVPGNHKDMNLENPLSTSSLLLQEQARFGDIIDCIHPDTYKSLPFKLHFATRWVMRNLPNVEWVVKVDDDCVVRVKLLQFFVLRQMNPNHPQVIGTIAVGARPHRSGKWAEDPKYTADEYPPWAFGSAGYVVSKPVAQYVADHDHYYYQGEDAGLGIWLADSGMQVTWVDSPELRKDEGCLDQLYIIGHDLSVEKIYECFGKLGDEVPERKYIIAFSAGRKDQFAGRIRNPN
ncbi:GalNAc:beta-1,3-N-acetylgalactosaminyltransferase2 [Seminavis robusta]|uniref:Hexosyltransferase n=1 Tax=Seminavis robusta TaxID=568900 RepID=A0A9N8HEY6_9STRA|nr:GalNAc:beta-1,3-N-acetylgalactosaminyltransferase2 [Seminavis robusta]|eukprot:Sro497_g154710.1 GalNAc:beta-1,3-N-acetylgalactosaminyltransferase 2 (446) ;mRNA; f:8907-10359